MGICSVCCMSFDWLVNSHLLEWPTYAGQVEVNSIEYSLRGYSTVDENITTDLFNKHLLNFSSVQDKVQTLEIHEKTKLQEFNTFRIAFKVIRKTVNFEV